MWISYPILIRYIIIRERAWRLSSGDQALLCTLLWCAHSLLSSYGSFRAKGLPLDVMEKDCREYSLRNVRCGCWRMMIAVLLVLSLWLAMASGSYNHGTSSSIGLFNVRERSGSVPMRSQSRLCRLALWSVILQMSSMFWKTMKHSSKETSSVQDPGTCLVCIWFRLDLHYGCQA